jgi:hypothetical protein
MAVSSTSFQRGESGNPGGRPKVTADVIALARRHTKKAVRTIAAVMNDPKCDPRARVAAAMALLDRGYGKPAQSDLLERIEALEALLRDRNGGNGNRRHLP